MYMAVMNCVIEDEALAANPLFQAIPASF